MDQQCDNGIAIRAPDEAAKTQAILGETLTLFANAERVSDRYKSKTKSASAGDDVELRSSRSPSTDIPDLLTLHNTMRELAIQRQRETSIVKKAKWALQDEKQFNKLVEDIAHLVDNLVGLFPAALSRQADDLPQTTRDKVTETRGGGHHFKNVLVFDRERVQNGDYVATGAVPTGFGHNIYDGVTASGEARVLNGGNYGGKSIFDD